MSQADYELRRMPLQAYFQPEVPFIDSTGLLGLLRQAAFHDPLLLVGPTGLGKTLAVYAYAQELGLPIIEFSCTEDTRDYDLIGAFGMEGDSTFFGLGALTTGIEVANEMHARFVAKKEAGDGAILLINECNALRPQTQKTLNPLLDFQGKLNVHKLGRAFSLDIGAKLWVVLTMNPSAYGGTNALNADFKRRVQPVYLDYPAKENELKILMGLRAAACDDEKMAIPDAVFAEKVAGDKPFVSMLLELAGDTRSATFEYALSTADLHQICRNAALWGVPKAMLLSTFKFEEAQQRAFFVKKVQSRMGVDVASINVLDAPAAAKPTPRRRKRKTA